MSLVLLLLQTGEDLLLVVVVVDLLEMVMLQGCRQRWLVVVGDLLEMVVLLWLMLVIEVHLLLLVLRVGVTKVVTVACYHGCQISLLRLELYGLLRLLLNLDQVRLMVASCIELLLMLVSATTVMQAVRRVNPRVCITRHPAAILLLGLR